MKRLARTLVLLFSLLGLSVPAQAANGMNDMMRVMMEMFVWMMGGGGGAMNPYRGMGSMNSFSNPLLASSMLGSPLMGNSLSNQFNNPLMSGWGNSLPYSYPGLNAGSNPYMNPYLNNNSTSYYKAYRNPYASTYSAQAYRDPNKDPCNQSPSARTYNSASRYNNQFPKTPDPVAPVLVQPIIVNPGSTANYQPGPVAGSVPGFLADPVPNLVPRADSNSDASTPPMAVAPPALEPEMRLPTVRPIARPPAISNYSNNSSSNPGGSDNPLLGRWQGVNGEYMELSSDRLQMRSKDAELQGTYQLKNGILKIEIRDREEPVYMQYKLADGHLMFRSQDGQLMLFRPIR